MTDYDREHLRDILAGHGDWYHARLLRLIAKADEPNRHQLAKAYPEEVEAVHKFQTGRPLPTT